jgi:hypothetical protein
LEIIWRVLAHKWVSSGAVTDELISRDKQVKEQRQASSGAETGEFRSIGIWVHEQRRERLGAETD